MAELSEAEGCERGAFSAKAQKAYEKAKANGSEKHPTGQEVEQIPGPHPEIYSVANLRAAALPFAFPNGPPTEAELEAALEMAAELANAWNARAASQLLGANGEPYPPPPPADYFKIPNEYDLRGPSIEAALKNFQIETLCDLRIGRNRAEIKRVLMRWMPFNPVAQQKPKSYEVRELDKPEIYAHLVSSCWPINHDIGLFPESESELTENERKSRSRKSCSTAMALARKILNDQWEAENELKPKGLSKSSIQKPNFDSALKVGLKRFRDGCANLGVLKAPTFLTTTEYYFLRAHQYENYIDILARRAMEFQIITCR